MICRWVFLLVAAVLLTGCGEKTAPPVFRENTRDLYSVADVAFQSFDEAVTGATDVLTAQFRQYHEYGKYTELEFTVKKSFKGETTARTIYVLETVSDVGLWGGPESFDYTAGRHNFVRGHEYLLILSRRVDVNYDHDRYQLVGELFIPLEDAIEPHMYGRPLREVPGALEDEDDAVTTESVQERVLALCEASRDTTPAYHGTMPILSEELSVVADASSHVLLVTVEELIAEGVASADTYSCTVREVLKGEISQLPSWKNRIFVTFRRGEAAIGGDYLLLLDRLGENSKMFEYSSAKASVHPVTSEAEKEALYRELGY